MEKDIAYYIRCFEKLRRDRKKEGAPHKPILLISLIQAYQANLYRDNRIYITPDLVGLFKSNWHRLVTTAHHCLFALPFYHTNSEPFWSLVPNVGCEKWVNAKSAIKSFSNLNTAIRYALIDEELSLLLADKEQSNLLLSFLLDKYFSETKDNVLNGHHYFKDIEQEITTDSGVDYQSKMLAIKQQLDEDSFQEEVFVRGGIFKREVPKIHNHTCCISGLRIDATKNISMIDACHIVPFAESYNDTISNGIALCPNLHRAFDRGLIAIDDDYKALFSNCFTESQTNYGLKQFQGKEILLPKEERFYPSLESLRVHRRRFGG